MNREIIVSYKEERIVEKQSYVIMLRPAPAYGEKGTEEIVGEHFRYLQELQKKGDLIMAGRFSEVLIGLSIIQAETNERAIEIMKGDPAVKAGIFHAELYPWRIALGN
ncbi:MAG: YciI family protein [Promethearchaeota archaeon]